MKPTLTVPHHLCASQAINSLGKMRLVFSQHMAREGGGTPTEQFHLALNFKTMWEAARALPSASPELWTSHGALTTQGSKSSKPPHAPVARPR
jgi:hypothetical protein